MWFEYPSCQVEYERYRLKAMQHLPSSDLNASSSTPAFQNDPNAQIQQAPQMNYGQLPHPTKRRSMAGHFHTASMMSSNNSCSRPIHRWDTLLPIIYPHPLNGNVLPSHEGKIFEMIQNELGNKLLNGYFTVHFPDRISVSMDHLATIPTQRLPSFSSAFAHQRTANLPETSLMSSGVVSNVIPSVSNRLCKEISRTSPANKRDVPGLIPLNKMDRLTSIKKSILPPIIRLVSTKKDSPAQNIPGESEELLEMGFEFFSKEYSCVQHKDEKVEDGRALLRSKWNTLKSNEKHAIVVAAKQEKENDENRSESMNIRSPDDCTSADKKFCQSSVILAKNEFTPTLQEYPANYETILIDFE